MPAKKKAQIIGGPREKLMQVLRASGASEEAAMNLTAEALGPGGTKKKRKKKKQASGLRQQIIARLRDVGKAAREYNPVTQGLRAGMKGMGRKY